MLVLGTIFLYIAFSQRQRFGSQCFICHLNCTLFVTCDFFLCVAFFSFHMCLFYVLPVFSFFIHVSFFYVLPPFQGNAQLWQHFSYHSASTWADIWTKKAIHCFSNIKS